MKIIPVKLPNINASIPMYVDEEDFDLLSSRKWSWHEGYARGSYNGVRVFAHGIVFKTPKGMEIDHIDGNRLNNQKINLRCCSHGENHMNIVMYQSNTSGFKGVSREKNSKKWKASISKNKKRFNLGTFASPEEASEAYKKAAQKLHKEFTPI